MKKLGADDALIVLISHRMLRNVNLMRLLGHPLQPSRVIRARFFCDWVLPTESFARIFSVDWQETEAYRHKLCKALLGATRIKVQTAVGTDISLSPRHWNGCGTDDSSVSEIFTAPIEESVNGEIVIDASIYWGKPSVPIRIRVHEGRIVEVKGPLKEDGQFKMFLGDLNKDQNASIVAELGLGINLGADPFGHVMEAECVRGTCHIDFGENISFGGKNHSASHVGGVLFGPTLTADGKTILKDGKLAV